MTGRHRRIGAALVPLLLCLGLLAGAAPAATEPPETPRASEREIVAALERAAHPLHTTTDPYADRADLRPLARMVRAAEVVGIGEATHGSHEFFALKHRVFRHLVAEKGFRTFALEVSWSTGLRLNDYVLHGKGDVRRIMREEFQDTYLWWNNTAYLELLRWMRAYNRHHPADPVSFMGDDFAYAGPELYDKVTDYTARAHPDLLPRITALYRGLRPTTTAGPYIRNYLSLPLDRRREMAAGTTRALRLLEQRRPPAPGTAVHRAHTWAVQHARALDQTARGYAWNFTDPEQIAAGMRYRDQIMADNVAWWREHTGDKILLSAHNGHAGYEPTDPRTLPKTQGAFLRDRLGHRYTNIGFTFHQGSFKATAPEGRTSTQTVGPARPGSNEHLLDRVRHRDYTVDLRTVPAPARPWLLEPRPTRSFGTAYPDPESDIALARSHDILIHLHRVHAARLLPGE
ncbi:MULTISPECIES: erythromycin esterase family protein [Streptomyces]|uniref:Erythromycin esterase family protein n=2 Tax=Streptomyces TaxID=1883 RepID=A0A420V6D4_9ACTN|nr:MULTISPECIES: erythromycin esterase family protein [Streptomyces]KNE83460.1 erythromycin esterase [Streptomyces fradiae]OFA61942.1 erythromycin esterase [Streptomyces fradiae]PQM24264.1 erythromycin esterase [Streptomyces xinghaiensis]RKM97229.1 erythromycin esterase family protein [Streptomyces xinghaiensis]RNC75376.1 erythromycin esterase family protein [Streptomyces xinghaiensis]